MNQNTNKPVIISKTATKKAILADITFQKYKSCSCRSSEMKFLTEDGYFLLVTKTHHYHG